MKDPLLERDVLGNGFDDEVAIRDRRETGLGVYQRDDPIRLGAAAAGETFTGGVYSVTAP